jgi:meiotic recombination protein SPO11
MRSIHRSIALHSRRLARARRRFFNERAHQLRAQFQRLRFRRRIKLPLRRRDGIRRVVRRPHLSKRRVHELDGELVLGRHAASSRVVVWGRTSSAVFVFFEKKKIHFKISTVGYASHADAIVSGAVECTPSEKAMSGKQPKSRKKRATPDEGVNFALKKLRDGQNGRPGSLEEVMRKVNALERAVKAASGRRQTLEDLDLNGEYREVEDRDGGEIAAAIEQVMIAASKSILAGDGFQYALPSRGATDQVYLDALDRIVLKNKTSKVNFSSVSSVRKVTILTRVMQLVHGVLSRGIHVTKRDLFYTDVKLFKDQKDSDAVLDDISCMLGCTRNSLHVVASEKGVVVGRLQYKEDGDEIDCTRMGVGGKAIPSNIDKVTDMRTDAKFVLLVEKDAAFMRLAEDRFYNKYPCIIITAKGQPDVATRLFLSKVKRDLKIPVLALVDADPYGLKIISVYMQGSKNMAFDSGNLTTPDIKWLGVRPSDLDKFKIPEQCRLEMTAKDIETGNHMLNEDFIKSNPEWVKEINIMLETKTKAEIQALSSYGFQYLSEVYLPAKLQEGDWV